MRPALAFFLLVPAVVAHANWTALEGLARTLGDAGAGTFGKSAVKLNHTARGQKLLELLADSTQNLTLFAPSDRAVLGHGQNILNHQSITDVYAYHMVSKISRGTSTASNITIGRTYLVDPHSVDLVFGEAQVVAWELRSNGKTHILNQGPNVSIVNTTSYNNIAINIINAVLRIPGRLPRVLAQNNLTSIGRVMSNLPYPAGNHTNATLLDAFKNRSTKGYTFFAPSNSALERAITQLAGLAGNLATLETILLNHVINSTVYSPTLFSGSQNYTSAAGKQLSVFNNASGAYVTSGTGPSPPMAKIIRPDVLVSNGVLYVIDSLLADTTSSSATTSPSATTSTGSARATSTVVQDTIHHSMRMPTGMTTGTTTMMMPIAKATSHAESWYLHYRSTSWVWTANVLLSIVGGTVLVV